MKKGFQKRKAGQAMVEYIIIVVVVAIAALVVVELFGDTIQKKFGKAVDELNGDNSGTEAVQSGANVLQDVDEVD